MKRSETYFAGVCQLSTFLSQTEQLSPSWASLAHTGLAHTKPLLNKSTISNSSQWIIFNSIHVNL